MSLLGLFKPRNDKAKLHVLEDEKSVLKRLKCFYKRLIWGVIYADDRCFQRFEFCC